MSGRPFDFGIHDAVMHAQSGDMRKLADLVEKGVELDEHARGIVAAHLRGTYTPDRRKRSYAMRRADARILFLVEWYSRLEKTYAEMEKEAGRRYRPRAGESVFLDLHGMNPDTLASILKRARRDRLPRRQEG